MFESHVTSLLTSLLGRYIKSHCFLPDRLSVDIWSGFVILHDLELKEHAFLDLGVEVIKGVISKIEIQIPWNALSNESVVITMDQIYLIVKIKKETTHSKTSTKRKQVDAMYLKSKKGVEEEEEGMMLKLRNKIIENLQVSKTRVVKQGGVFLF